MKMMKLTIDGYQNKKNNKYLKWYRNIILKRIIKPKSGYHEKHHIIPKSLGGSNDHKNIVKLSAREHFLVHYLLTKFILGKDYYKVLMAFHAISAWKSEIRKDTYLNSRLYESTKKELSKVNSERLFNMWKDDDTRNKIIEGQKKSWVNGKRNTQLENMKNNSPLKNKKTHKKTIETRTKRGSNVFSTHNPMKDEEKALKIASKRSGDKHYSKRKTKHFYRYENENKWHKIPKGTLHKFREENGLTRTDLEKLLENNVCIKNIYMRKEDNEN